jgi:phospholipase/lecithinase/hemolysin
LQEFCEFVLNQQGELRGQVVKTLTSMLVLAWIFGATGLAQPTITVQPINQTASLFADAVFRVTAAGDVPLSYQWQFNRTNLANMTQMALNLTNIQRANAGDYDVIVANSSGSVTSRVATLTITPFNSMYEFGYSWTDTHNCTWDPTKYWHNHACNGPMWPEYVSTNLGLAYVEANNYAACGAGAVDILNQVSSFTISKKPAVSLFCLWIGTDVNETNVPAYSEMMRIDISNNSNSVNQLYAKGARQIVIHTHQNDSKSPFYLRTLGSAVRSQFGEYEAQFNAAFRQAMQVYNQTKLDLRIIFVDVFSKFNEVLADPAQYGFTKADIGAVEDPALADKSFTGPGAEYVYWNQQHGTAKLHQLISSWTLEALTNSVLETLEATAADGAAAIQMNHLQIGRDYTLQQSTDLHIWREATSFTASAGTNQWTTAAVGASPLFYRLTWLQ